MSLDRSRLVYAITADMLNAVVLAYSKYLFVLQPLVINEGEVFVVPENVIMYASEVYVGGEIYVDGELRFI